MKNSENPTIKFSSASNVAFTVVESLDAHGKNVFDVKIHCVELTDEGKITTGRERNLDSSCTCKVDPVNYGEAIAVSDHAGGVSVGHLRGAVVDHTYPPVNDSDLSKLMRSILEVFPNGGVTITRRIQHADAVLETIVTVAKQ